MCVFIRLRIHVYSYVRTPTYVNRCIHTWVHTNKWIHRCIDQAFEREGAWITGAWSEGVHTPVLKFFGGRGPCTSEGRMIGRNVELAVGRPCWECFVSGPT